MSLYSKIIDLQKLHQAWRGVYKNKPKEGVDGITCEAFDDNKKQYLKELYFELRDHQYECQPVHLVSLYKGEKVREISLFCMRDKTVQNSIAYELSAIYESGFSDSAYAYRSGKSALIAAEKIQEAMEKIPEGYALKTDISGFFDHISHKKLLAVLRQRICEEDVLQLIRQFLQVASLDRTGELLPKREGVYQGSSIAPVLSNIYMMDLDRKVSEEVATYIRYSDDMVLLFGTAKEAEAYLSKLKIYLGELGLEISEKKTSIHSFEEGFEFLGFQFQKDGITVPVAAEEQLAERLEKCWMEAAGLPIEKKMQKAEEILNGWEQYYRCDRNVRNILELVLKVNRSRKKGEYPEEIREIRHGIENTFRDVAAYMAAYWKEQGDLPEAVREYEDYCGIAALDASIPPCTENPHVQELLKCHETFFISANEENRLNLMQIYSDLKMYRKAEYFQNLTAETDSEAVFNLQEKTDNDLKFSEEQIEKFMQLFVGREDLYAIDEIGDGKKRLCSDVIQPLLPENIQKHLSGEETIGTYIQRTNGTVKYLVLDLDISKRILLQVDDAQRKGYLEKCFFIAGSVQKELKNMGLVGYTEFSGYRGYHVWIFFEKWIPVRYANLLADLMEQKMSGLLAESGIQLEFFPNKTRLRNGKKGQRMKLPLGFHPKTGVRSYFLDPSGTPYHPESRILEEAVTCPLGKLKRVISANQQAAESEGKSTGLSVDTDLSAFGNLDSGVKSVLESCHLVLYLCQKARKTQYLGHFERLSLLYVLGHLGDSGKKFLHQVMSFTMNYSYQVTEKFIRRCPEKPISCLKLREQYRQISAELGCSCNFRRTKNCYPSPVLHALKLAEENTEITIPTSRTLTQSKELIMKNEINAAAKVQTVAEKMLELRRQKRGMDRTLKKYEEELNDIFNDLNTDSLEIRMGLLVRRRRPEGTEWIIEL